MNIYRVKKRIKILLTGTFILLTTFLFAQDTVLLIDKLYLNNGSIIYGSFMDYHNNGDVSLQVYGGRIITFPERFVKKVKTKKRNYYYPYKKVSYRDKHWYHRADLSFLAGNNDTRNELGFGVSLDYSLGYRFRKEFGLGLGVGWTTFSVGTQEYFLPLKIDMVSYFSEKAFSPFVRLQIGRSFSIVNKEFLEKSNGGWMINPSIGWVLGGQEDMDYTIDIGFIMQKAYYRYNFRGWRETITEQDVIFRRFLIRFGILF